MNLTTAEERARWLGRLDDQRANFALPMERLIAHVEDAERRAAEAEERLERENLEKNIYKNDLTRTAIERDEAVAEAERLSAALEEKR